MPSSASEMITARFSAESLLADPVDALREALFAAGKHMAGAGFAPPHLVAMRWESADPDNLDPALMPVNLAYREVFVGFRPPITRIHAPIAGVRVEVESARSATPPSDTITALERDYSARRGVDMEAVLGQWRREGAEARDRLLHEGRARLDLAFGDGPFSKLDLFLPKSEGPHPCWVFLHGGYWMATDKAQYAQFAGGMLAAGYAVALPNYALAPEVPVARQVGDTLKALHCLKREAHALGLDPARFHLSGHSAGAHLAALAVTEPDAPEISSLLLLSGLYDVAALGPTALGRLIGFADAQQIAELQPLSRTRPANLALAHALGEREAPGFFIDAKKLEAAWGAPPGLFMPGDNHFSLLEGLKSGPLLDLALKLAR